jgi:hypothetical protein
VAVHHRRRQVQGDPPHVWQEHANPALSGSQGPQHCRASAQGGAGQGLSGKPGRWRRAEQLIRNLARRLDKEWPGIAATILEGIDEILCVLPKDLRRSLACTNIIENMNGTIRQVTRNVKRWRDGSCAGPLPA